jgi:toxin ParE1/3/4
MKYKIILTEQADKDLKGIYEYIAINLQSPENAKGQLNRLELKILSLKEMPNRFKIYEKEPWHSRGLLQMHVDNFIVFYIVDNDKAIVTVIRVMYNGRDMYMHLKRTSRL